MLWGPSPSAITDWTRRKNRRNNDRRVIARPSTPSEAHRILSGMNLGQILQIGIGNPADIFRRYEFNARFVALAPDQPRSVSHVVAGNHQIKFLGQALAAGDGNARAFFIQIADLAIEGVSAILVRSHAAQKNTATRHWPPL